MANEYFVQGYQGGTPESVNFGGAISAGSGRLDPTLPEIPSEFADAVYYVVNSIWDPRTLRSGMGDDVYADFPPPLDYVEHCRNVLELKIYELTRRRQLPGLEELNAMIDNIVDTSRMLGIYLTTLALGDSRDPQMFQRNRTLSTFNALNDMQAALEQLPLPRNLASLVAKYTRLMDTAGNGNVARVGFLHTGGYDAFLSLYQRVIANRQAHVQLKTLYQPLGVVGHGGNAYDSDVFETFVNALPKGGASDGFCPYIFIDGASEAPRMMASAGVLHTVFDLARVTGEGGRATYTQTGFAAPGSGYTFGSTRVPVGVLTTFQGGVDRAILASSTNQEFSGDASGHAFATFPNGDLAENLVYAYCMSWDFTSAARQFIRWPISFGPAALTNMQPLARYNPRYRPSQGMSLGRLSFRMSQNIADAISYLLE